MSRSKPGSFGVYDIALMGMVTAVLSTVKQALAVIPNVELVSFFIIIFTLYMGWKILPAIYAFVSIEFIIWGFGIWSFYYLYVWTILALLTMLLSRFRNIFVFCTLSGAFGLGFGGLCAFTNLFITGPGAAFGWWLAGIPFDLIHAVSNFIICLVLYKPIRILFDKWLKN